LVVFSSDGYKSMSLMSKTGVFVGLRALRDIVSDQIAVDMGSATTVIWVSGHGIVVDEPSLVAINSATGRIIAVGVEAGQMAGREARNVKVVAPMANGVVGDFVRTREMLSQLIAKARHARSHFTRRAIFSVLSGMTAVEQRAFLNVASHARIHKVWMVEEGLASAFGAGVKATDSGAAAIIDIGAGAVNIAIVSKGAIIHSRGERIGSAAIDAALINHIRRNHGVLIGPLSAERLKIELASAAPGLDSTVSTLVKGRNVETGQPTATELTAGEVYGVVKRVVDSMLDVINQTFSEVSPEVDADLFDRGIILTGGGAQLRGLEAYFRDSIGIPVQTAEEPAYATIRGLAKMFDEPSTLRRLARATSNRPSWATSASGG
jgi:rod shape-determining protein MreB